MGCNNNRTLVNNGGGAAWVDNNGGGGGGKYYKVMVVDEDGRYKVTGEIKDEKWIQWYLHSFPSGYRFVPGDDELIEDYLTPKLKGEELPINMIKEVNIYKYSPAHLTALFPVDERDAKEWYFFTPRDRKYPNGERPDRAAGEGYWKATGADKKIYRHNTRTVIGYRKSLVYYEGKAHDKDGKKTNWIMHEFRTIEPSRKPKGKGHKPDMRLDDCILVRIYEKAERAPKRRRMDTMQEINTELQSDGGDELVSPKSVSPKSVVSEEEMADEDEGPNEIPIKKIKKMARKVEKSNGIQIKEVGVRNTNNYFTNTTFQQQQPLPKTTQNQHSGVMLQKPDPLNWNPMFLEQQQFNSYMGGGFNYGDYGDIGRTLEFGGGLNYADIGGTLEFGGSLNYGDIGGTLESLVAGSPWQGDEEAFSPNCIADILGIPDPETHGSDFYALDCPPALPPLSPAPPLA